MIIVLEDELPAFSVIVRGKTFLIYNANHKAPRTQGVPGAFRCERSLVENKPCAASSTVG